MLTWSQDAGNPISEDINFKHSPGEDSLYTSTWDQLYCILSAFKIDCIYLIFLEVFDVSCFDLGNLIERPLPPLLDQPQIYNNCFLIRSLL